MSHLLLWPFTWQVNTLLDLDPPKRFDFLIQGEFLRASLAKFIEEKGLLTEEIVKVEIIEAMEPPLPPSHQPHDDWVMSIAGRHDGLFLTGCCDSHARLWSDSGDLITKLVGHKSSVTAVAWVPSGEATMDGPAVCVTGSQDEMLRLWAVDPTSSTAECGVLMKGHTAAVTSLAVQPTGKMIASGGWDDVVRLWSAAGSEADDVSVSEVDQQKRRKTEGGPATYPAERKALGKLSGSGGTVFAVVWPQREMLYSAGADHCVRQWDVAAGTNTVTMAGAKVINGISYSEPAGLVAAAEFDGVVRLYDPRARAGQVCKFGLSSHRAPSTAISWRPGSENQLASGSMDKEGENLKLWDIRSRLIPVHNLLGHSGKVFAVDWASDCSILSGGSDGKSKIHRWEARE